ncbi:MAG: hypothetical protein SF097_19935 [Acidobacteriota bacterium]|nr:hypothetical protein [Acidobacteriota bacterium]
MNVPMTTIEVNQNAAVILRMLQQKAEGQGTTLEELLKPLAAEISEPEEPREVSPRNEAMLAVIRRTQERLKNLPVSGSTEDSLKILDEMYSEEDVEGLDVFSLRHMPPEDSFVVQMRFVEAGEGEPARYDFSGIFDDEEIEAE